MEPKYYQEYEEALAIVSSNPYNAMNDTLIGGLIEASNGTIVDFKALSVGLDSYFGHLYGHPTLLEPKYQEYKDSLEKLNYLARRAQYYECETATPDTLLKMQKAEVAMISDTLSKVERTATNNQVDLNVPTNNALAFDINQRPVEKGSYKMPLPVGTPKAITSIDSYSVETNEASKKIKLAFAISEYQTLKNKLNVLMNLTPEQYKMYRINQIALSQEEIQKMEQEKQNDPSLLQVAPKEESASKTM